MLTELEAEVDRMFGRRLPSMFPLRRYTSSLGEGWAPSSDVYEKEGELVVKAELPGVQKEDIDVSVENGDLVVEITTNGSWGSTSESEDTLAERGRGVALMRGLTELQLRVDDDCVVIRLRPPQP